MAGYSGTPLIKKLGIRPGAQLKAVGEPEVYWDYISPLPDDVVVKGNSGPASLDFIHVFVKQKKEFEREFLKNKRLMKKDGMLWISWPKKSAKVPTDLDENIIRNFGLNNGLVDVKVCAVDDVWSGLKFMFRLKDR
jgi:hypothetical protein